MTEPPNLSAAREQVDRLVRSPKSGRPRTPAPPGLLTVPAGLIGALDVAGIVAAGATGHRAILIGCVVLLVLIVVVSVGRYRAVRTTTLSWESQQAWSDGLLGSPQRGVVDAVAVVAPRITDTPVAELRRELDRVDAYAYYIAAARRQSPDACAAAWEAVLDRVAALTAYADALAARRTDELRTLAPLLARPLPDP